MTKKEEQFFTWFFRFGKRHKLKVYEIPVHKRIRQSRGFENLRFIVCYMRCFGHDHWSTGVAFSPQESLLRSGVELIERAINTYYFPLESSNGTACHFSVGKAKQSAGNELLERDAYFSSFLAGHSLGSPVSPDKSIAPLIKSLEGSQIYTRFFRMQTLKKGFSVSIAITSLNSNFTGPYFIGTKCSENWADAQKGSFLEGLQTVDENLRKPRAKIWKSPIDRRSIRTKIGPLESKSIYLNPDFYNSFKKDFLKKSKNQNKKIWKLVPKSILSYEAIHSDDTPFYGSQLIFVKARSPYCQRSFWGFPEPNLINYERLFLQQPKLLMNEISWDKIPFFP